jgi:tetratricopeptide (TPR) repeat protein
MREFGKAFREFQRGGTEAEAHNNIGFVYEAAGDLPQAEKSYVQALRIDPKLTRARENLEHAARKAGHPVPEVTGPEGVGVAKTRNPDNIPKETKP